MAIPVSTAGEATEHPVRREEHLRLPDRLLEKMNWYLDNCRTLFPEPCGLAQIGLDDL
jgi:hypothetical protein